MARLAIGPRPVNAARSPAPVLQITTNHVRGVDLYAEIRERLHLARGSLSNAEVARQTGTHPESVRRYLRSDPAPVEFLVRFAGAMGVSIAWLTTGEGVMCPADAAREALRRMSLTEIFAELGRRLELIEARNTACEESVEAIRSTVDLLVGNGESGSAPTLERTPARPPAVACKAESLLGNRNHPSG